MFEFAMLFQHGKSAQRTPDSLYTWYSYTAVPIAMACRLLVVAIVAQGVAVHATKCVQPPALAASPVEH
jgi:hypothetical protein